MHKYKLLILQKITFLTDTLINGINMVNIPIKSIQIQYPEIIYCEIFIIKVKMLKDDLVSYQQAKYQTQRAGSSSFNEILS